MSSTDKLFLLDACALMYHFYYTSIKSPRINSKGFDTSAILGFVNTLGGVLKKENPTHIGVTFDPSGPTFRHEAYEQYKVQWEEILEAIRLSVPIMKDIIRAYRIPILEVSGYEANDMIGTLTTGAGGQDIITYMMTPDKDHGQLVPDNAFMYCPKHSSGFEVMGTEEIKDKFNIHSTKQVIDMLGLMGDSSDNIPDYPGVGEKTTQKLVAEFGNIENLLAHTDQLKGAPKTKMETNREMITFSKFPATIGVDIPIKFDMTAFVREEPDEEKLRKVSEELEFRTFIDRVLKESGAPPSSSSNPISPGLYTGTLLARPVDSPTPEDDGPVQGDLFANFADNGIGNAENSSLTHLEMLDVDYQLIDTEEKRSEIIQKLLTTEILSIDTGTTGTGPTEAELVGMSFSNAKSRAYYIPVPASRNEALKIVNEFRSLYENENSMKVGQNIKYNMIVLQNYGMQMKGELFGTILAHYVLQPESRHNMDYLAEIYLRYRTIHIDGLIGSRRRNQKSMHDLPPEDMYHYAYEDIDVALELKNVLEEELKKQSTEHLFYETEMPLIPVLVNTESNGVHIGTEALKQSSERFTLRLQGIKKETYALASGETFNVTSPEQVGGMPFDELKVVERIKKTKTGQYVTSGEVLENLRNKHAIIGKVFEYRGLEKLLSTYIDALPQLINPRTGRIHTSSNQAVTTTGRLSSSNPNLQNIPTRDEDGREVRKAFIPDDGCEFFSADYSQIGLRIMAHLSQDRNMIDALLSGYDIHAATAAKIYKTSISEVTTDMCHKAKAADFSIVYGVSVFGLAERMSVSHQEAKELIDGYFETHPQIREYMDRSIQVTRKNGYVETIFHCERFLPGINSRNTVVRGYAERSTVNVPVQGGAADIIKVTMSLIYQRIQSNNLKAKVILQVHGGLNFSVPEAEKEIIQKIVIEEVERAYRILIPLKADFGWGKNWLETH